MQRTNWTKKVTILLAVICVLLAALSAFAPANADSWLLKVEGVAISREIYSYFLSAALEDAELNEDGTPKNLSALRKDVSARCVEYVAVNSELHAREIPLDSQLKSEVAERTASDWRVFGRYYTSIGVDKQTLNAVLTNRAGWDQLFRSIYDTGGSQPTTEEELQAYFYGTYVAYEGIRVFPTVPQEDGTDRAMIEAERAALKTKLESFVVAANESEDFYATVQDDRFAEALGYGMPSAAVVRKAAGEMSEADFEKVRGLSPEKVALLELDGFFLVARGVNMRNSPEEYYNVYRSTCLYALKGEAYAQALADLCKSFRADENVAAVNQLLDEWAW